MNYAPIIDATQAHQEKHATCDIQSHPWHAVFGAGFEAGWQAAEAEVTRYKANYKAAYDERAVYRSELRTVKDRAEAAEAEVAQLRAENERLRAALTGLALACEREARRNARYLSPMSGSGFATTDEVEKPEPPQSSGG